MRGLGQPSGFEFAFAALFAAEAAPGHGHDDSYLGFRHSEGLRQFRADQEGRLLAAADDQGSVAPLGDGGARFQGHVGDGR